MVAILGVVVEELNYAEDIVVEGCMKGDKTGLVAVVDSSVVSVVEYMAIVDMAEVELVMFLVDHQIVA